MWVYWVVIRFVLFFLQTQLFPSSFKQILRSLKTEVIKKKIFPGCSFSNISASLSLCAGNRGLIWHVASVGRHLLCISPCRLSNSG